MNWIFFILIGVSASTAITIWHRLALKDKDSDPIAYSIVFQFTAGFIILIYALISGFDASELKNYLPNILLMVVSYYLFNYFRLNSLKKIEASKFTILFQTGILWTVLGAIIFLNETVTFEQFAGIILIILSVIIVTAKGFKFNFKIEEIFALAAAPIASIAFLNDVYILRKFDIPTYSALTFLFPALFMAAVNPKKIAATKTYLKGKRFLNILIVLSPLFLLDFLTFRGHILKHAKYRVLIFLPIRHHFF